MANAARWHCPAPKAPVVRRRHAEGAMRRVPAVRSRRSALCPDVLRGADRPQVVLQRPPHRRSPATPSSRLWCFTSLLAKPADEHRERGASSFDAGPCAERQGSRPVVVQIASERRRGRTAGRSATAPPQGFHSFWGWPLPGPCSCYLDHCAIRSRERSPFDGKGRAFAREVDDRIRMRRRVGRLARARGPASPLEGLTATVTFVNDSDELYEVRVDGGRWRGRPPILVTGEEVELLP